MFSEHDKLACAQRKLALRQLVYPRLIENKKLKPAAAERELALMAAIAADYEKSATLEAGLAEIGAENDLLQRVQNHAREGDR